MEVQVHWDRDKAALWQHEDWSQFLGKPGCLVLVLPLLRQGSLERRALVREAGLSVNGAAYHLRAMRKAGLLQIIGPPSDCKVFVTQPEIVSRLLDALGLDWRGDPRETKAWRDAQNQVELRRTHSPQKWYARQKKRRKKAAHPLRQPPTSKE